MTGRDLPTLPLDGDEDEDAQLWEAAAADATEYAEGPIRLFGECTTRVRPVVFEKGAERGRRDFDARVHTRDALRYEVKFTINPVDVGRRVTEQAMITRDRDYAKITGPSMVALGLTNPRQLNGRWVEAHLVDSGRWRDPTNHDEGQWKALKFVRLFGDEDECWAAAKRPNTPAPAGAAATPPAQPPASRLASTPPVEIGTVSRENAVKFLPALWEKAEHDITRFLELIRTTAPTRGLSIDDPDVMKYCLPAETAEPIEPATQPGGLPATPKQKDTIVRMARAAGKSIDVEGLSRAQASEIITSLIGEMGQVRTGSAA